MDDLKYTIHVDGCEGCSDGNMDIFSVGFLESLHTFEVYFLNNWSSM